MWFYLFMCLVVSTKQLYINCNCNPVGYGVYIRVYFYCEIPFTRAHEWLQFIVYSFQFWREAHWKRQKKIWFVCQKKFYTYRRQSTHSTQYAPDTFAIRTQCTFYQFVPAPFRHIQYKSGCRYRSTLHWKVVKSMLWAIIPSRRYIDVYLQKFQRHIHIFLI